MSSITNTKSRDSFTTVQKNVLTWLFKQADSINEEETVYGVYFDAEEGLSSPQEQLMNRLIKDGVINNAQALALEDHINGVEPVKVEETMKDVVEVEETKENIMDAPEEEPIKKKREPTEYQKYLKARAEQICAEKLAETGKTFSRREARALAKAEWQIAMKEKKAEKTGDTTEKKPKKRGESIYGVYKKEYQAILMASNPEIKKGEAGREAALRWKEDTVYSASRKGPEASDKAKHLLDILRESCPISE